MHLKDHMLKNIKFVLKGPVCILPSDKLEFCFMTVSILQFVTLFFFLFFHLLFFFKYIYIFLLRSLLLHPEEPGFTLLQLLVGTASAV